MMADFFRVLGTEDFFRAVAEVPVFRMDEDKHVSMTDAFVDDFRFFLGESRS